MDKAEWIALFRGQAETILSEISHSGKDQKVKARNVNKKIKAIRDNQVEKIKIKAQHESWSNDRLLHEILLLTYASDIVMLESRNAVWGYEYMAFARRIGELWEQFCKLPFDYPIKSLTLIDPPNFDDVKGEKKQKIQDYISELDVTESERRRLKYYYSIPWEMIDSCGIKLALDLHFEQNGIHYNCDFKSGYSSNEKGNANRLLLVASIYNSLGDNERTYLLVRQNEDENNHYLQTLKNSPYWEVFCSDECYATIKRFTGFDLRAWLDDNIDWENDISKDFRKHLESNDLIKYLTW